MKVFLLVIAMFLMAEAMLCESQQTGKFTYSKVYATKIVK